MYKKERDVLRGGEEDNRRMRHGEVLVTLGSSEKTIAILGDRWWPQAAKQEGDTISETFLCTVVLIYGNNAMGDQLLEMYLKGVRGQWSNG